jgi:hypothetical protein
MANKHQIMETWFQQVWTKQNASAIDQMFAPEGQASGLGANALVGPQDFKVFHAALSKLLDSFELTIDKSIESDDWISAVCTLKARSIFSGAVVTISGHVMARIEGGKIMEAYNHWDFLGMFSQTGQLPKDTFEQALAGKKIA